MVERIKGESHLYAARGENVEIAFFPTFRAMNNIFLREDSVFFISSSA